MQLDRKTSTKSANHSENLPLPSKSAGSTKQASNFGSEPREFGNQIQNLKPLDQTVSQFTMHVVPVSSTRNSQVVAIGPNKQNYELVQPPSKQITDPETHDHVEESNCGFFSARPSTK